MELLRLAGIIRLHFEKTRAVVSQGLLGLIFERLGNKGLVNPKASFTLPKNDLIDSNLQVRAILFALYHRWDG